MIVFTRVGKSLPNDHIELAVSFYHLEPKCLKVNSYHMNNVSKEQLLIEFD